MRKPIITLCVLAVILLLGCGTQKSQPKATASNLEALTLCPAQRPEICTMDYRPVCGVKQAGEMQQYANGCGACADVLVVGFTEGGCDDKERC